jgi:uncharacterized protein YprB with RNaseH-like and TPR domain
MKLRAYLDIETTGLSRCDCELTVIGIGIERGRKTDLVQLVERHLTKARLLKALTGIDEIYTYNGSRFDLPFITEKLDINLKQVFTHTDLMYDCWRQNLKGGLKAVERELGIRRRLTEVDGFLAVQLWWDYINNNNKSALATLLEYNKEDVLNLRLLRGRLGVR